MRWQVWKMGTPDQAAALAVAVASRLRAADARELWAAGGHTPEQAVRESLRRSLAPGGRAWAVLLDERAEMVFGVVPVSPLSDTGVPWMLATTEWDKALAAGLNLAFARRCRAYVNDMGRGFARLENHVHADNRRAIRWLAWLGFRFDPPAPWGVRGEMFLRFWSIFTLKMLYGVERSEAPPRRRSSRNSLAASNDGGGVKLKRRNIVSRYGQFQS